MFHFGVYGYYCVKLSDYIKPFSGSRLRKCHLDTKCYISTIQPLTAVSNKKNGSISKSIFSRSFFYRVHLLWNNLPLSIREIIRPSEIKRKWLEHLWNNSITDEYDQYIEGILFDGSIYLLDSETEYTNEYITSFNHLLTMPRKPIYYKYK